MTSLPDALQPDRYRYGPRASGETHGVVLTKPHIVELILDLAGFGIDEELPKRRLLEPSCGRGAFLVPAVQRLLESLRLSGEPLETLKDAITAFDIDAGQVERTKSALIELIASAGHPRAHAERVVQGWIRHGDFLLAELPAGFDCIVGNPPYIRIEQLATELQAEYRRRYASLSDRADLYVAFIERSLRLLGPRGLFSFICADRWTLNRYGARLRRVIADGFKVHCYIDLHEASPFDSDVVAYPSIFLMSRGTTDQVRVLAARTATPRDCRSIRAALLERRPHESFPIAFYDRWFDGDEPWTLSSPAQLRALRDLESRFSRIEADGSTHVRIGVATGCDDVYIVDASAPIEPSRLQPLAMRSDLAGGKIASAGRFVINTFEDRAGVVDLVSYPRLRRYLERHDLRLKRRHIARKNGAAWFRTIDRVYPELTRRPKLLIPDIAGANEVTFDPGHYYPHHNLYFVVSDAWDLEVLGGILSSRVALFFVWSYAVKMRGGYLRFQAQYLRRIRVPNPKDLSLDLCYEIKAAFRVRNFKRLDELALEAYGLESLPAFDFVDTRH